VAEVEPSPIGSGVGEADVRAGHSMTLGAGEVAG
jgi:hypothetical protein